MTPRLHRRPLEVCVFPYLDHGLRRGDVYVEGSEASADSRQQLLPWDACVPRLPAYCQALQCAPTATEFVAALRERLREVAQRVAAAYPANTALTMDEDGTPPRKRLPAQPVPDGLPTLAALLTARLPERHLLAILKHVHYWVGYPRHFGPLSGTERTLSSPVLRYLFTVFGYAGELGASQTACHTTGPLRRQRLRRLHAQHMTTPKLEAAGRDGIAAYTRFELPFLWGSGHAAMAEGTPIALLENTLLGAQHVRYGRFGGIASHHIRDTSIALFSHFIACGVWEAVDILAGLRKHLSALRPDMLSADTHGQAAPVFGLAVLVGITRMPRMRTWNDVTFYRVARATTYTHIDALFTHVVDWDVIERHGHDMRQGVLAMQAGTVLPSLWLQKLGVYRRHSALYKACSALGRVERTLCLLAYMSAPAMRQQIRAETTKVESYHPFTDWLAFGGPGRRTGDPVEQKKRIKYREVVANAVRLPHVVDMTNGLYALQQEGGCITPEVVRRLSPYLTEHIKRFGQDVLDMETLPEPLDLKSLFVTSI
jgi:TnpA family transposase